LGKIKRITQSELFKDVLGPQEREVIIKKIDTLQEIIDEKPKGRRWKMRAKIGEKVKWYKEVHTVKY
jgi:hypothetical protein